MDSLYTELNDDPIYYRKVMMMLYSDVYETLTTCNVFLMNSPQDPSTGVKSPLTKETEVDMNAPKARCDSINVIGRLKETGMKASPI